MDLIDRLVPVFRSRREAEQFLKTHPPIYQSDILKPNERYVRINFDTPEQLIRFRLG